MESAEKINLADFGTMPHQTSTLTKESFLNKKRASMPVSTTQNAQSMYMLNDRNIPVKDYLDAEMLP